MLWVIYPQQERASISMHIRKFRFKITTHDGDENTKIAENVKPWYIIKICETIHTLKNRSITNFT